jgi:hypothetical protein
MSYGGLLHEDTNWTAYRGAREAMFPGRSTAYLAIGGHKKDVK